MKVATLPIAGACSIASASLLITHLGTRAFGVASLLATLILLTPFADMGLSAVVVNALADPTSTKAEASRKIDAALRCLLAVTATALLAVLLIGTTGRWSDLTGVEAGVVPQFELVATISLAFAVSAIPLGLGQRVLTGLGHAWAANLIGASTAPVSLVLVGLGLAGKSTLVVVAAPSIAAFLASLIAAVTSLRLLHRQGYALPKLQRISASTKREVLNSARPMLIVSTALPLALYSDRIILSHFFGEETLGELSACLILYTPLWGIIAALGSTYWPRFSNLPSTSDKRTLFRQAVVLFAVIGSVASLLFAVFAGPAVEWIADGLEPTYSFIGALAALILVQAIHLPAGMLLMSESGLRFQSRCIILMAICNLALSVILSAKGVQWGSVASSAVTVALFQALPAYLYIARAFRTIPPSQKRLVTGERP